MGISETDSIKHFVNNESLGRLIPLFRTEHNVSHMITTKIYNWNIINLTIIEIKKMNSKKIPDW